MSTTPTRHRLVAVIAVAVAVLASCSSSNSSHKAVGAAEVFLEPAGKTGRDPFTRSVAVQQTGATVTTAAPPTVAAGSAIPSSVGSTAGLYGGTRDETSCNKEQLIQFLEATPDKAAAWADVLGIRIDQIRQYVNGLTPVVLIRDTRVTNHGFVNAHATTLASVLQAGTAVLVDSFGVPRVKCGCGNPLTQPVPVKRPLYTGPKWTGFAPGTTIVVVEAPVVITVIVLVDIDTGDTFGRPIGTDGTEDGDAGSGTSGAITAAAVAGGYTVDFLGDLSGPCLAWPTGTGSMTIDVSDDGGLHISITLPSGTVNEYVGSYDAVTGQFTAPDVEFGRNPLSGTLSVADGVVTIADGRRTTQNVQGTACIGGFTAQKDG